MSVDSFFNVVRSFGLEPDSMDTGRFVRFPGQGKRASNRAGWYFLSDNLSVGWFGDWSTGLSEAWRCEDAAAQQFRWQANRPGRSTTIRSAPAQSGCQYAAAERARDMAVGGRRRTLPSLSFEQADSSLLRSKLWRLLGLAYRRLSRSDHKPTIYCKRWN